MRTHRSYTASKSLERGNRAAFDELTPKVYLELRRAADNHMRNEKAGNTMQATALVHEVFLKLMEVEGITWRDRAHFLAVSANMMRRILVDRARARDMGKRGGKALHINLDDAPQVAANTKGGEILAIDEALDALGKIAERKARVVKLRFFGGLTSKF